MSDNVQYSEEVLRIQYDFALNQKFTDFKLRAGGKTVHCHRSVIAAKSEYFRSICDSGSTEAALDYSVTKEEDSYILDCVIRYLYLGQTDITKQNVMSLVLAADFIRHNELKRQCEDYMISQVNVQNLMTYHRLSEKAHLPELNKACQQFSLENFSQVVSTEWYLSLSIKEVEEYLRDDALNVVSEDDVIDAILKWLQSSRASQKGKEDYMEVLMPCIRLEFCTKSKLEVLSKDKDVMGTLRLMICEYLLHEAYGGQTARASYSGSLADRGAENIFLLGGRTSGLKYHKDIRYLDEELQASVITQAPFCLFSVCTPVESNSLIVSGGQDYSTGISVAHVKKFCLITKIWTDLPNMKHPVNSHGSTVINNKLFTLCGLDMEKDVVKHRYAAVNSLNLHTLIWSTCPPIHHAVSQPGIASIDADIYVFGGNTGNEWSSEVCKFSTQTGKWSKCQNLPKTGNIYRSTVVVHRKVFILNYDVFLQYDVDMDQWHKLPKPLKPSYVPAMVQKQGRLVTLGGYKKNSNEPHDLIQTYDLSSKKWSLEKKKLPLPLCFPRAVVGRIP